MLVERPIMQKAVSGSHRALNGVVQTLDSKLIFGLADGDDDVQLVGTLIDHADIDVGIGDDMEDVRCGSFGRDHTLTDNGDEGEIVLNAHLVGVQLCFNLV